MSPVEIMRVSSSGGSPTALTRLDDPVLDSRRHALEEFSPTRPTERASIPSSSSLMDSSPAVSTRS